MDITWSEVPNLLGFSAVFASLGITIFGIAFWVMAKVCPFSIRKEIEDDQNTALAVIMGSVIIGIAIIISKAIG